jgi:TolA-binding protein
MTIAIRLATFGGCLLLTSVPGVASAQAPAAAPGLNVKGDAVADGDRPKKSADAIYSMRASLRQVTARVEDARNEKDVVKLNCVNEKLAQIKGLLKVAEQSENAFKEAAAAKDPAANGEYAKIMIAKGKVDTLGGDAQQCIGQLAYVVDEKTTVEVQQPRNQPERETSGRYRSAPPPSAPVVLRPPCASCF